MPGICEGGECVNTDGSFRCECPMGFVLDSSGRKCVGKFFESDVDENECRQQSPCGSATCQNTMGTYRCACPDGYVQVKMFS